MNAFLIIMKRDSCLYSQLYPAATRLKDHHGLVEHTLHVSLDLSIPHNSVQSCAQGRHPGRYTTMHSGNLMYGACSGCIDNAEAGETAGSSRDFRGHVV
jgi:hypothetical protein